MLITSTAATTRMARATEMTVKSRPQVTTVPTMAPECAAAAGMDLRRLTACANRDGNRLVARWWRFVLP